LTYFLEVPDAQRISRLLSSGNVVDLAVGVVIGVAFGAVVTAFVKDLLTPVIAAIAGKPDFSSFYFELNGAKFLWVSSSATRPFRSF